MREQYAIYLRKSRADVEAEARGEGETLAKHQRQLIQLAKTRRLPIGEIYREVVSGDTIASRPEVQRLLDDVDNQRWKGVIVMDIDRLARGDTIDQGVIAQSFKYSQTLIVTPTKTYDPNNEYDEEYFEFGLFMARREYQQIRRRLQRGRTRAAQEGKFIGNKPPYGYRREKLKGTDGWTLVPVPEEANYVRLIFDYYVNGGPAKNGERKQYGYTLIANRLNELGAPTRSGQRWSQSTVRDILINPVYIGKQRVGWRKNVRSLQNGSMVVGRPVDKTALIVDGLHEAIIDQELWNRKEAVMKSSKIPVPYRDGTVKNPLCGLVVCGKCGKTMLRKPYANGKSPDTLYCNGSCGNVSSPIALVEQAILDALADWAGDYRVKLKDAPERNETAIEAKRSAVKSLEKELVLLKQQSDRIFEYFERELYDEETFLARSKEVARRRSEAEASIQQAKGEVAMMERQNEEADKLLPNIERVLTAYHSMPTAQAKNELLKSVLVRVVYTKEHKASRSDTSPTDFKLSLYPRIPGEEN